MKVKCNMCEAIFDEKELAVNEDEVEICPYCHTGGCISDYPQTIEEFEELMGTIAAPGGCKLEVDDVEHNVIAVCQNCGEYMGTYLGDDSWSLIKGVTLNGLDKGLCNRCYKDYHNTTLIYDIKLEKYVPKPYGYITAHTEDNELVACCMKCGSKVGNWVDGYGWIFSSSVDFGKPNEGLCDQCIEEDK